MRYLPPGAKIGNRRADYTIVGTYPKPNALSVLQDLAKQPNEKSVPAPGGGIAVYSTGRPDERLRRLSRLRRADRGLRPVRDAGAAPRDVGARSAHQVTAGPVPRVGRFSARPRGALVRLRTAGRVRRGRAAARSACAPARAGARHPRRRVRDVDGHDCRAGGAPRGGARRSRDCCSGRSGAARADLWALGTAIAVFAVFAAPVVLSGEATFAGYIKLDDTATYCAMTDRVMEHARDLAGFAPSTYEATLATTLAVGYPTGALMPIGIGHAARRLRPGLDLPAVHRVPRGDARALAVRAAGTARPTEAPCARSRPSSRHSRRSCSATRSGAGSRSSREHGSARSSRCSCPGRSGLALRLEQSCRCGRCALQSCVC